LVDEAGQPTLEIEPLSRALAMIGLHRENLLQSHQLKTLDEAWQYHQLGLSDFVWTRSDFLLEQQAAEPALAATQDYSPTPGVSGSLTPLTTSWAWTITTGDPARQALATELILFLTAPENLANWSARSHILPARRDAMTLLAAQNPYYQFASTESERALAMPVSATSRLLDVMGDAVFQVLTTDTPPLVIAEQALAALRQ
jgi:ABC-type glycerol-3-phosphate transport system substrate-binding protein